MAPLGSQGAIGARKIHGRIFFLAVSPWGFILDVSKNRGMDYPPKTDGENNGRPKPYFFMGGFGVVKNSPIFGSPKMDFPEVHHWLGETPGGGLHEPG